MLWAAALASVAWEMLLGAALGVGLRLKGWTCEVCHAEKDSGGGHPRCRNLDGPG